MAKRGIQIPTIDRIAPVAPSQEGQLSTRVVDTSGLSRTIGAGISAIGGDVIQQMRKAEREFGEQVATDHANTYDQWARTQFNGDSDKNGRPKGNGLRYLKGDPTDAYNKFDDEADSFQERLLNTEDYSETVKRAIQKRLTAKHNQISNQRSVFYGQQYQRHVSEVVESSVALNKQGAMEDAAFVQVDDLSTVAPFEKRLSDIGDDRVRHAVSNGSAAEAEGGEYGIQDDDSVDGITKYNLSNSVKVQIAKDQSDATFGAINTLIAADDFEKASFMMKRYSDNLDPVNKAKLEKSLNHLKIKEKAFILVAKAQNKSPNNQLALIRGSNVKQEIKQEALKQLDANERYKANIKKRDSKQVFDQLYNEVDEKMRSNDPYTSTFQMEDNESFKRLINRVTDSKQRQALFQLIEKPKESSPGVMTDALDAFRNDEFIDMSAGKLAEMSVGLSKSDSNFLRRVWVKENTETVSQEGSKLNRLSKIVKRQFQANKLIKTRRGKETAKSKQKRADFETRLMREADSFPENWPAKEMEDYVRRETSKYIIDEANEDIGFFDFSTKRVTEKDIRVAPPERSRGARRRDRSDAVAPSNKSWTELTSEEQSSLVDAYEAAGNEFSSVSELIEWRDRGGI